MPDDGPWTMDELLEMALAYIDGERIWQCKVFGWFDLATDQCEQGVANHSECGWVLIVTPIEK